MTEKTSLDRLSTGESLVLSHIAPSESRRRMLDLGFLVGEKVRCVGVSPMGDPLMLVVGGKVVAVRRRELKSIFGILP
jgi:ferrous iron transport protein A